MKNNTNILTGFENLDTATGGFKKGDLILLASRPSQGKTTLALNIAHNVSVKQGIPVAIFSLEMNRYTIYQRMVCSAARAEFYLVNSGKFKKENWENLTTETKKLSKSPLTIDDTPVLSIIDIRLRLVSLAKALAKQGKTLGLIVIDYFDLIKSENKTDSISSNIQALKELAVEFDVPILVCHQLRRKTENDETRPKLKHLRYPQFTDTADLILFIHREYYYTQDEKNKNSAEILIEKPFKKTIKLLWQEKHLLFSNKNKE